MFSVIVLKDFSLTRLSSFLYSRDFFWVGSDRKEFISEFNLSIFFLTILSRHLAVSFKFFALLNLTWNFHKNRPIIGIGGDEFSRSSELIFHCHDVMPCNSAK